MASEITNRLYELMQEKIVNESILDPKLRDLNPVIIKTLKKLPKLTMVGYRKERINPRKLFEIEMEDSIIKKTNNTKKNNVEYSIDLEDSKVDILRCYFIIKPDIVSPTKKDIAVTNTKYKLLQVLDMLDEVFETKLLSDMLNSKDKIASKNVDPDNDDVNLVLEVPFLVPRLMDDQYFLLNDRKFFSAFYLQREAHVTSKGKLEIVNINPGAYKGDDEILSYIYLVDDGSGEKFIEYMFFGNKLNPFCFLPDNIKLHKIFPEYFSYRASVYNDKRNTITPDTEEGKILLKTYNKWVGGDKVTFKKKREKSLMGGEEDDYVYKLIKIINDDEIIDAINSVLNPKNQRIMFDIHRSLRKFLKINIIDSFPGFSKRQQPEKIKKRYRINPETVVMLMKMKKQYTSTVVQSANSIDIFPRFTYISEMESGSKVKNKNLRKFRKNHVGLIDPIATSTSENLGLSGMMVFSVPDEHIVK